jgi:chitinase
MTALTHIVHWGALVNADGSLNLDYQRVTADAPTLVSAAHAAGVKAILGVIQPYWLGQRTNFQQAATSNRAALVDNIMRVADTYGFDGVDLDWEPFNPASDGPAMNALAADLKARLGTRTLTVAATVTEYQYWGSAHGPFDRVNVMTYDLTGTWNAYSWHNAALFASDSMVWSVDLAVKRFTAAGVPAAKLGIGIPFYGWQWSGGGITGPNQHWSSNPSTSQVYYQQLASMITPQNSRWDSTAMVPYLSDSNSFVTYDNEQSIAAKIGYAKSNGLGGWIIWNLGGDYFPSQNPKHPLLTAVKNAMLTH